MSETKQNIVIVVVSSAEYCNRPFTPINAVQRVLCDELVLEGYLVRENNAYSPTQAARQLMEEIVNAGRDDSK